MSFAVHLEDKGEIYVRKVYGIFDLIAYFGGLSLGLILIINLFMSTYA